MESLPEFRRNDARMRGSAAEEVAGPTVSPAPREEQRGASASSGCADRRVTRALPLVWKYPWGVSCEATSTSSDVPTQNVPRENGSGACFGEVNGFTWDHRGS